MPECGPYRTTLRICISKDMKERLEKLKDELGVSISYLVEKTLKHYLDRVVRELVEEAEAGGV